MICDDAWECEGTPVPSVCSTPELWPGLVSGGPVLWTLIEPRIMMYGGRKPMDGSPDDDAPTPVCAIPLDCGGSDAV